MPDEFTVTFESSQDLNTNFSEQFVMGELPYYEGTHEVTPSQSEQVLQTAEHSMSTNIVIHPIPSNYGLITYNGFEITVS